MKITLPENISDITLEQFQKYHELMIREDLTDKQKNDRKISIFTGFNHKRACDIAYVDYNDILKQIDISLNQTVEFKNRFKIKDVEFGFIPNFDEITQGEFIDMKSYEIGIDKMHNLMAVLFRPIKNKDPFGNYTIVDYNGTKEFSDVMKNMPLSIVNGALIFFLNLSNELMNHTLRYTREEQPKEAQQKNTLKSGDGTQL